MGGKTLPAGARMVRAKVIYVFLFRMPHGTKLGAIRARNQEQML